MCFDYLWIGSHLLPDDGFSDLLVLLFSRFAEGGDGGLIAFDPQQNKPSPLRPRLHPEPFPLIFLEIIVKNVSADGFELLELLIQGGLRDRRHILDVALLRPAFSLSSPLNGRGAFLVLPLGGPPPPCRRE